MEVAFGGVTLLSLPGRVMTPRSTSEQLVAAARARVGDSRARIADVGTGSGAVGIGIAKVCPRAELWASDTSPSAVRLAGLNVRRHGLVRRVHVRGGDLLAPLPGRFDVIAANLPYVPAASAVDHPELAAEPFDAVFAAGDGLGHCRRLVAASLTRLADDGVLLLQIDGRMVTAERDQLPALGAALASSASTLRRADLIEAIAGVAA